jgi:hypothetical protein
VAPKKKTPKLGGGAAKKQTAKKAASKKVKASPGAPSTQDLYTGMSGQFAAMSEFLWRGYNVAIPAVDVGEDIFVVEAGQGVLRRVQVKTAGTGTVAAGVKTVQFNLSRSQLNLQPGGSDLFFMLLARWDDVDAKIPWRFLLLRSEEISQLRLTPPRGPRRGPPPLADGDAKTDVLKMTIAFSAADAVAWGHSLTEFLDKWSKDWPVGSAVVSRGATASALLTPAAPLASAQAGGPPPPLTADPGTKSPQKP